jgi:2-succinyl-5-enolpyruvyl-6-hydroxy-3-cyclohexene-1-carboxylate synthase
MARNRDESGNVTVGNPKNHKILMHPKQHISTIAKLLMQKGVEQVVISPGSRNAPLIKLFFDAFKENCFSIVDERSAAFFGLGLSIRSQKPVVILSTSGTAILNFAPAIAEAYYQGIPLIAITADRPSEWIDQQDNQTIRQKNSYSKYCKFSCELPLVFSINDDIWYTNRLINEAYNRSVSGKPGPVHINVPLREPLYEEIPVNENVKEIEISTPAAVRLSQKLIGKFTQSSRILIVCGQMQPDEELSELLNKISDSGKAVVLAEHISNIRGERIVSDADFILASISSDLKELNPELVIYFGGQVISKRLKAFLRNLTVTDFWLVTPEIEHTDTFKNLSVIVQTSPKLFLKEISESIYTDVNPGFSQTWTEFRAKLAKKLNSLLPITEHSDLKIFQQLSQLVSPADILFAGNSSVVRYFQMFSTKAKFVFSNRGTSGIDGCLSTASGIAQNSRENVYAVLGDLSFVYDSNALWNRNLPKNLKIIIINNSGGGIFAMLEGPSTQSFYNDFLVAHHPVDISKLCAAFGVVHYKYSGEGKIEEIFNLYKKEVNAALLEITTPADRNPEIFRNFIKNISK